MAERTYTIMNAPQYGYNSTTAPAKIATGNTRRTMLQIQASPLGPNLRIIEWGIFFDSASVVAPFLVELLETGTQGASGSNWQAAKMPYSTLATAIASTATTSFVLATGGGVLFVPQYGGSSQAFTNAIGLIAPNIGAAGGTGASGMLTGATELVAITARSTDTLTVTRNIDGRGAITTIPIGSPLIGLQGQFQRDIVADNNAHFMPSSVVWQNCGWSTSSTAPGTDLGNVTENRFLAPPQTIEPIGGQWIPLPLGREPEVEAGKYARIVVTAPATANASMYIKWAE